MMKSLCKLVILLLALPLSLLAKNAENLSPTTENQYFETPSPYTISGYVTNEGGVPLEGVILLINGTNYYTDENGFYSTPMFDIPVGSFAPYIFDSWQNNLDTADIILYRQHMFGFAELSPYKLLAGDLNGSSGVSTFNSILLTKIVLGIDTPDGSPWRFILADYVFPDPTNPWEETIPESVNITTLPDNNLEINWIAYKMGDIDCSAGPDVSYGITQGQVFIDEDEDCIFGPTETTVSDWTVILDDGDNLTYTTTDDSGAYSFFTLAGDYQISVIPPYDVWASCLPIYDVVVQIGETTTLDLGIQIIEDCPILEIEIATYGLVRCEEGRYFVNYKNVGTATAENTILEITFDDFLTVTDSELAWTSVDENTYSFDIGVMEVGDFESFSLTTLVACDAIAGQTHCVAAYISPDDFCGSPEDEWDGSSIELYAWCDGDSLHFEITNTGENMQSPVDFEIVEDDLVMTNEQLQLPAGGMQVITIFANGSTFRLKVDQSFGHPGNSMPTIAIEGCGENEEGEISLGYVTIFPEDDENPFLSIHCVENTNLLTSNNKDVFPKGIYEEHFINANTAIEYLIHFQNTTGITATNVMIKDSVFTHLDPSSIRLGPSSHPYQFTLTGNGVANFIFHDIMLPDSSVNDVASRGFVTFYIQQKADLPLGTQIINKAEIHFNANPAVTTNMTLNTIGADFLEEVIVHTKALPSKEPLLSIYPLPADDYFIIECHQSYLLENSGIVQVFDVKGNEIWTQELSSGKTTVDCKHFPKGAYWVKVLSEGEVVLCKKIVVL